jgi:RNA polymerase-binding transcription factor DksA
MIDAETTRSLLERERTMALKAIATMESDFKELVASVTDANTDDEHDPEGATIAFERAQLATRVKGARTQLVAADTALEKLAAGRYGTCEVCEAPIAEARLLALPTVRTCYRCAMGD